MGFEVEPTGLGSTRWYARIAVALGLCALIVGIGFAARQATEPATVEPTTAPAASAPAASAGAAVPSAQPVPATAQASYPPSLADQPGAQARPLPKNLDCHGLAHPDCVRLATAALGVLTGELPGVAAADVYASLICNSSFDCPRTRLTTDAMPLGSVTLSFVDGGPSAWINVVQHGPTPTTGAAPAEAWLIRWR